MVTDREPPSTRTEPPTLGRLDGLEPVVAPGGKDRGKAMLSLSGSGYRAALFHLGALTRLNELGLLARVEVVGAVAGGSILAALLETRVPWPLNGAYREWPERVAEPMREIARRNARARAFLRSPMAAGPEVTGLEERHARRLIESLGEGEPPQRPRFIFGGAGLVLGEMGVDAGANGGGGVSWEIGGVAGPPGYDAALVSDTIAAIRTDLVAFGEAEQAVLENHGYLLADAAIREGAGRVGGIEPLPPEPPHPSWMAAGKVHEALAASTRRTRLGRLRPRAAGRPRRVAEPASAETTALLERHRPFLQYDSLESYRADSVETIAGFATDRRCNTLHRSEGDLLAAVSPAGEEPALTLDFLGGPTYADGKAARSNDYLDECGGAHAADAHSMRRGQGFADVAYGRARRDDSGRLWLQYWFFYYYNDKGLLGTGLHEGDWEMVQLRLGENGQPEAATYGQHAGAERAAWEEVEKQETGEGPAAVVYPARGSHASRFRAGSHEAPAAPDHNDGLGPRVRPRLVVIDDIGPSWVLWPGRWGSTRRREAFEADSPHGPREQPRWWNPEAFHLGARPIPQLPLGAASTAGPAPPTPRLLAMRDGERALVEYSFPKLTGLGRPARIVAAACQEDDPDPPLTQSFITEEREGSLTIQIPPGSNPSTVRVSAASTQGVAGETVAVPLITLPKEERAG